MNDGSNGTARLAPEMTPLMLSGFTELATGALTGWVFAATIADPEKAKKLGVRSPARARQWHLDLIALGGLSILVSTALPRLPRHVEAPLIVGCWANAMAFGVLMVHPEIDERPAWRAAIGSAFVTTSTGFVGAARVAWRRRKTSRS
jgi:hypothetical protein